MIPTRFSLPSDIPTTLEKVETLPPITEAEAQAFDLYQFEKGQFNTVWHDDGTCSYVSEEDCKQTATPFLVGSRDHDEFVRFMVAQIRRNLDRVLFADEAKKADAAISTASSLDWTEFWTGSEEC